METYEDNIFKLCVLLQCGIYVWLQRKSGWMFEAEYVTDVKWLGGMKQYSLFQKYWTTLIILIPSSRHNHQQLARQIVHKLAASVGPLRDGGILFLWVMQISVELIGSVLPFLLIQCKSQTVSLNCRLNSIYCVTRVLRAQTLLKALYCKIIKPLESEEQEPQNSYGTKHVQCWTK